MEIINILHRKGETTESYSARVQHRGLRLRVAFNCQSGDLLIDKWYLLGDDEVQELTDQLVTYFRSLMHQQEKVV